MERRRIAPATLLVLALGSLWLLAAGCEGGGGDLGTRVFRRRCAVCHGSDGAGRTKYAQGKPYVNLVDGKWKHAADAGSIRRLIVEGDPSSLMPPFRDKLSPEEVDAVVRHVLVLASPRPTPAR